MENQIVSYRKRRQLSVLHDSVAQLVEQWPFKPTVVGSIPTRVAIKKYPAKAGFFVQKNLHPIPEMQIQTIMNFVQALYSNTMRSHNIQENNESKEILAKKGGNILVLSPASFWIRRYRFQKLKQCWLSFIAVNIFK